MNINPFYRWFFYLLTACLALGHLFLAGCGDGRPKRVSVSGQVFIDGKPLEAGSIQVWVKGNRPASGEIGPNGRFTLATFEEDDGCVLGKHRVAVIANKNVSPTDIKWYAPKKYRSPVTSGLEMEVNSPRDDVEIHLTWKDSGHNGPFVEKGQGEE